MSVPSLPSVPVPKEARVWFDAYGSQFRSPLTGAEQRLRRWGMWRAVFSWQNREQASISELEAFLSARGVDEEFYIVRPDRLYPRARIGAVGRDPSGHWNYVGYTPSVQGASQVGRSLVTDGWPFLTSTAVLILSAGDVVTLGSTGEHFQITADVTSSPSTPGPGGVATLPLGQFIRTSPADNALITVVSASIKVRLDRPTTVSASPPLLYSLSAEMSESF